MPIRFRCQRCRQLLGIASRKAGSEIECPKCGISQTVPAEEAASAALAMDQFSQTPVSVEAASDFVVYEDRPAAIETSRSRPPAATGSSTPSQSATAESATDAPPVQTAPEPGRPVPRGMILFPRRVFYVQGVLFLVVALAGFGLGYFIGRGDTTNRMTIERKEAAQERTQVRGKLIYDRGGGVFVGDEGAVVIALPEGGLETKIPVSDIRPQDPKLSKPPKSIRLIRECGGQFARAKASGDFDFVVPDKGDYCLLIISKSASRPGDTAVDELDVSEMQEYFSSPEDVIGNHEYRWIKATVDSGLNPIEIDFGLSGQ